MIVTSNSAFGMVQLASPGSRPAAAAAAAAPLIYCAGSAALPVAGVATVRRLPLTSMPPPPPPPPAITQQQQQQQQQQQPPPKSHHPRSLLQQHQSHAPEGTVLVHSATDSAYASHYASRYGSALPSGSASRSCSPAVLPPLTRATPRAPLRRCTAVPHHLQLVRGQDSLLQRYPMSLPEWLPQALPLQHPQFSHDGPRELPLHPTAQQQRNSPYAVVLPRGQTRLLDETAAAHLCRRSLQEELDSAVRWLGALDWSSAAAFEAASDEAAVMEDEFRSSYDREPPPVTADSSSSGVKQREEAESRIVLADTLLSMVEAAWSDSEDGDELRIGSRTVQAQQRCSKPKKEDAIYNVRYKTLPCLHWQKNRNCPAGDHCHFAHGPQELRQPHRHPKFKTQICQNYKRTGSCVFGSRCFFKHSDEASPAHLKDAGTIRSPPSVQQAVLAG
uniref:C3H1-type domain-containing protein n=1 Tax=Macrostomum lignano TaxID=282301 RepID=A0A1I8IT52_9PLAT